MQDIVSIYLQNPIGQTFWIIWMAVVIFAFLQKDDRYVVKTLVVANIFWILHFYFMWIYIWLVISSLWLFRLILSLKYKRNIKIFYAILILTIGLWAITYENYSSLFPILASWLSTYWFFFLEKVKLRLVLLLCSSFWFSFHYLHFSIGWVINESIIQIIHLFTIYKIISSEWTFSYYVDLVKTTLIKPRRLDYWRYLAIPEYISFKKK